VVRLIRDYRSTPEVVGLANAVIRQAAGEHARMRLELVGQRPAGPAPQIRPFADEPAEAAAVAARCRELIDAGLAAHQIAVLFRTNAQSPAYEEACAQVGVPTVVQGGERFFRRAEVRQALIALRAATRTTPEDTPLVDAVTQALVAIGWRADQPPGGGAARERWEALSALVALAQDWVAGAGHRSLAQFCEELAHRASILHAPPVDGVTLTSLHSAKGLEWEAVFVVGLAEGTLPSPYAKTPTALEEERRLLYVGITRARQWLWLSYASARSPGGRSRRPCRFLPVSPVAGPVPPSRETASVPARRRSTGVRCRVCGATLVAGTDRKLGRCASCPSTIDEEMYERLRQWRGRVATAAKVPAYVVFTDATLIAITERTPTNRSELAELTGIGPHKLERYGEAVLALVAGASVDRLTEPSEATDRDG
jgi:DNA helicase-2/ATP-dependent DNA helicase PcrA